jgi:hypothetical protein
MAGFGRIRTTTRTAIRPSDTCCPRQLECDLRHERKKHLDCRSKIQARLPLRQIFLILDVINMRCTRLGEMSGPYLGIVTCLDRFRSPNSFQAIKQRSVNLGEAMNAIVVVALLGWFNLEKVIQLGVGEKTLDDLESRRRRYGSEIGKESDSDSDSDGELHGDENCTNL